MRVMLLGLAGLLLLAPPGRADDLKKDKEEQYQVPYRQTLTKHILVRAKINGKGPFNFILDTGAPAVFIPVKVSEKIGLKPDKKDWAAMDKFEIEGGVVVPKARAHVMDIFQLEGMNGLGIAGAEIHGVIGYEVLARYRMTIDFTRDKMVWVNLNFDPQVPKGLGAKGGAGGLEMVGQLMKLLGGLMGRKADPVVIYRGFLGVEVEEKEGNVIVKDVLAKGPADTAGLKAGDRIAKFKGRGVYGVDDLHRYLKNVKAGDEVSVTVERNKDTKDVTIKAGEGL